jgi:uncharacterized membrane protein YqiK
MGNLVLSALVVFLILLVVFAKFYHRSSKDVAFVRTGFGGEKIVLTGGALAIPIIHQITPVSMSSMRLDVVRALQHALITKDYMRVDIEAAFYVRVVGTKQAVALAAQTLGARTLNPLSIKELLEGKLVDAVRAAVTEMTLDQLHSDSRSFIERARSLVGEATTSNGLELEYISLSRLDQTPKVHFDPSNTFDAQGLIRITQETEDSRRTRNEIEKSTEVRVQDTNLKAEEKALVTKRGSEYARLQVELEIAQRRAEQAALVARVQAEQRRSALEVEIAQTELISTIRLASEQTVEVERIRSQQQIRQAEIEQGRALEVAEIERNSVLKIASEDSLIALLSKQQERALSSQAASEAEAQAAAAEESILTAREVARAERERDVNLIRAERISREKALAVTISAEAEQRAAVNIGEARKTLATAEALSAEMRFDAEAEGQRKLNESANMLSAGQVAKQLHIATIEALPGIIRESVKPLESIEGIKIIDLGGLGATGGASPGEGSGGENGSAGPGGGDNMIDRLVGSALRYRMQAPVVDNLLREVGLVDGDHGVEQIISGRGGPSSFSSAKIKKPPATDQRKS